jgi:DNA-nicking Smr family endonuclease
LDLKRRRRPWLQVEMSLNLHGLVA